MALLADFNPQEWLLSDIKRGRMKITRTWPVNEGTRAIWKCFQIESFNWSSNGRLHFWIFQTFNSIASSALNAENSSRLNFRIWIQNFWSLEIRQCWGPNSPNFIWVLSIALRMVCRLWTRKANHFPDERSAPDVWQACGSLGRKDQKKIANSLNKPHSSQEFLARISYRLFAVWFPNLRVSNC